MAISEGSLRQTTDAINHERRRLLGGAVAAIAAAQVPWAEAAQSTFGALKQINAGVLSVGYAEAGPANGTPVILLHGWPYDIHTYVDVAPLLAEAIRRLHCDEPLEERLHRAALPREPAQRVVDAAGHVLTSGCASAGRSSPRRAAPAAGRARASPV